MNCIWKNSRQIETFSILAETLKAAEHGKIISGFIQVSYGQTCALDINRLISLQTISVEPLTIVMFSESQLLLAKEVLEQSSKYTVHLDATGSVVKNLGSNRTYLYSIVLPTPMTGEPPLPLLEWLSDSHNTGSISSVLFSWWLQARNFIPPPAAIVIDFSWAFLHATSNVFNNMSLEEQLNSQWQILCGESLPTNFVSLRLCASHFIKAIGNRLSRKAVGKQVSIKPLH